MKAEIFQRTGQSRSLKAKFLYGKTANVKAKFNMRLELKDGMAEIL